ncbi:hypothetical protein [Streptomyces sp. NPDC004726]
MTAGDAGERVRRGPRHAAPRQSLLTKLQRPAGKAIALAAMPTAVFVGMSLTPKLAIADEGDIPFAPGPCVTRSDESAESESRPPEPTESARPSQTPTPTPSRSTDDGGDSDGEDNKDSERGERGKNSQDGKDGEDHDGEGAKGDAAPPGEAPSAREAGGGKPAKEAAQDRPDPKPEEAETRHPLDPLGIGEAIEDLFDGPDDEQTPTPGPAGNRPEKPPEKPADPKTPAKSKSAEPDGKPAKPAKPAELGGKPAESAELGGKPAGTADGGTGARSDGAADRTEEAEAIKDAARKAGVEVEELDEDAKGLDPRKDEDIPEGAKPNFPCPTADPEALEEADLEQGIPALPDDPWTLKSSKLTLRGLDYKGIVKVRTGGGQTKHALKFTATSVDIKDLHQLVVGPEGTTGHVESRRGSTSTIRDGTVTMYTEELKGNLFGVIPVTFSPRTPPPLNVPLAIFTDVTVKQAGQFGGTLTIPGLHNYFTGG